MKRILSIVTLAAVTAASCTTQPSNSIGAEGLSSNPAPVMDTAGYAEFKAFQQWKTNEATTASYAAAEPATRTSKPVYRKTETRQVSSQAPASSEASEPVQEEKKGWSKAAKGAVIGAGSGAVIGAVVHKRNRAVGAAVGGVVGGGVGYGIGRHMDKKDGRY